MGKDLCTVTPHSRLRAFSLRPFSLDLWTDRRQYGVVTNWNNERICLDLIATVGIPLLSKPSMATTRVVSQFDEVALIALTLNTKAWVLPECCGVQLQFERKDGWVAD